jgi:hypothetical protein
MKDTFSEPFTQGGEFHPNYSPAKYSKDADQDLPFIYGNEDFHFHRQENHCGSYRQYLRMSYSKIILNPF